MLWTADGQTISIHYVTVPRAEIERRLNAAEENNAKREEKLREFLEVTRFHRITAR